MTPGYIGVGEKKRWCFRIETQIFFKKEISLKKKGLGSIVGSIAGCRLPQTPEVDDFDQRNGSSNHLRHLAISSYRRWRFDELHVLYRIDWWILIFDIFLTIYIYLCFYLFIYLYSYIHSVLIHQVAFVLEQHSTDFQSTLETREISGEKNVVHLGNRRELPGIDITWYHEYMLHSKFICQLHSWSYRSYMYLCTATSLWYIWIWVDVHIFDSQAGRTHISYTNDFGIGFFCHAFLVRTKRTTPKPSFPHLVLPDFFLPKREGFPTRPETLGQWFWFLKLKDIATPLESRIQTFGHPPKIWQQQVFGCPKTRNAKEENTFFFFCPATCIRFSSSCVCNSFCYMSSPLRPDWTDGEGWFQKVSVRCFRSAFHGLTNCQVYQVWKRIGLALNCEVMTIRSPLHMDTFNSTHPFRQCWKLWEGVRWQSRRRSQESPG